MPAAKIIPHVVILKGTAVITKAIESIATRGKKLDKDIHQAACSVLAHAADCGDVTLAQRLLEALPKSGRKNALVAWLVAFGPFAAGEKAGTVVHRKLAQGDFNLAAAEAEPFWEFAPEPAFVPFDLKAQIERLIAKAEKAAADAEHADENAIDLSTLDKLRQLTQGESNA